MPDRLYGTPEAGMNNYLLFEEVSQLADNGNGFVQLRKTTKSMGKEEYPPVYSVEYFPGFWESHDREFFNKICDIADRHEAKVEFGINNGGGSPRTVVKFSHR